MALFIRVKDEFGHTTVNVNIAGKDRYEFHRL
jgi:hypothetical protein